MRSLSHLLLSAILFGVTPSFASSQIYRYTDDAGTLTFTNELRSVPPRYRSRAVPLYTEITATAGTVAPVQSSPQSEPAEPATRVITVSSDYRMGAHDTRTDALRVAIESAKRQAVEQVATYLESVTEVRNLDLTREEIRTYTAGMVMVLDQQTSTRTDEGAVIVHVDLTAQVDRGEAIRAIAALRENESAARQLVALRTETDRLRQDLDAANQALAAAPSQEQIHALTAERQRVLDRIQADALVSQAWTQVIYAYPGIGFLGQGLSPLSALPPSPAGVPVQPGSSLPSAAAETTQRLPSPLAAPLLQPAFPQIQPLGVPHGSLHQTPAISTVPPIIGMPQGSLNHTPAIPTVPQIIGTPQGSFPQGRATPTFPQIQPQGVPHGSLFQTPAGQTFPQAAERFSGSSRGGGPGR